MTSTVARAAVGLLIAGALVVPAHTQSRKPRAAGSRPKAAVTGAQPPTSAPPPATASAERKVPFRPGELLTYDVSWSTFVTAGIATLAVQEKRPSGASAAYYIVAEGKPTGLVSKLYTVYYKMDTLLDTRTLLPVRGSIYSQEGNRRRTRITVFDHAAQRADYQVKTTTDVRSTVGFPRYTQDALSALYALRAVPLRENSRLTMPVCDGGSMYRVQFSVGKAEPVRIGGTQVSAFRITPTIVDAKGTAVGRPMTLWISADTRQLPLKLHAELGVGSINLALRDVPQ